AKVTRSMEFRGARYIHILVPCPLGWGSETGDTIKVARLATECGLFPLYEAEYGWVTEAKPIRRPVPVEEYLKTQKRFAHLFRPSHENEARIAALQRMADRNIQTFELFPTGDRVHAPTSQNQIDSGGEK